MKLKLNGTQMNKAKKILLLGSDAALLYASLAGALAVRYQTLNIGSYFSANFLPFSAIFSLWILVFYISDFYRRPEFASQSEIIKSLARGVFVSGLLSIVILYLFPSFFRLTPKTNLLLVGVMFLILSYLSRIEWLRLFKIGGVRLFVLGGSQTTREISARVGTIPYAGYRIIGTEREFPGDTSLLFEIIKKNKIEVLLVDSALLKDKNNAAAAYEILRSGIRVLNSTEFYENICEKEPLEDINAEWFVDNVLTRRPFYDAAKRSLDILLSCILTVAFFIPFIIISCLIKTTSRGPVLFSQKRTGQNGNEFTLHKFRTMKSNENGPLWTTARDSRITPVGKALRKTHLDEIPQLWNILKGDVSFAGPRPERVELAKQYEKFPFYHSRHIVKPGLTGWAQINFRSSASLEEAFEKLKYDVYYVKNRSLVLDLMILIRTVRHIFGIQYK